VPALTIAIYEARYEPPSKVVPALGARVDAWFKRALARKPEDRFTTAAELARTFRVAVATTLDDEPVDEAASTEQAPRIVVPSPVEDTVERAGKADTQPVVAPRVRRPSEGLEATIGSGPTQTPADRESAPSNETPSPSPAQPIATLGGTTDAPRAAAGRSRALGLGALGLVALVFGGWYLTSSASAPSPAVGAQASAPPSSQPVASLAPAPSRPGPSASDEPAVVPMAAEVREAAPAPSASASARSPARPAAAPPPSPKKSAPSATSKPSAKAGCEQPFTVNAAGDLVPRPECF
jgi:serine/threonine-protein kinase